MKHITAIAEIKRLDSGEIEFKVVGRSTFLKMVGDFILGSRTHCEASVVVKKSAISKTNEQLGYYFGVVCHYVAQGFKTCGYEYMDFMKADYELRMMFLFEQFETPKGVQRYPASLEQATIEEVAELIDNSIMFCAQEFGIDIPPPDKNRKKL